MARRMTRNSHVRCRTGEKVEEYRTKTLPMVIIMKEKDINLNDVFKDDGVYSVCDILNNLDKYVGMSLEELMVKFCCVDDIIGIEEVCTYCRENFSRLSELKFVDSNVDDFINSRISDYEFLKDSYSIYKEKGLMLLDLMQYIAIVGGFGNRKYFSDEDRELYLEKMGIFHKNSVITGVAVKGILVALINIIDKLDKVIMEINDLSSYDRKKFDWFAQISKADVLPSKSLVYDEAKKDITCVKLVRRRCC